MKTIFYLLYPSLLLQLLKDLKKTPTKGVIKMPTECIKVLEFIKGRSDFQEGLDKLIEFSKSDIMENIIYE